MGIFDIELRFDRKNWFDTFSASLGDVFVSQIRFTHTIVKDSKGDINLEDGTITFGNNGTYDIQIIGIENLDKNIWQWGFQDLKGVDKEYLKLAYDIKALGVKFGNEALREPCFQLNDIYNGHTLSTVACAVQKENYCYHKCEHPAGALYVAIKGLPDEIFEPIVASEFLDFTLDRIKHVTVNQKIFVESFLQLNKIPYMWESGVKLVSDFGEKFIVVEYKLGNGFLNISQMRMIDPVEDNQEHQDDDSQE